MKQLVVGLLVLRCIEGFLGTERYVRVTNETDDCGTYMYLYIYNVQDLQVIVGAVKETRD